MLLGLVLLMAVPAAAAPLPDQPRDVIVLVRENPRAHEPNLAVDLWVVDTNGGKPRRFVGDRGQEEAPTWSPDGRKVAFDKSIFEPGDPDFSRSSLDVWTVDATSRRRRNLTRDGSASSPAWSPAGRKLAFARGNGVFVVNRNGGGRMQISRRNDPGTPAWSPDGRRLAFAPPGELRVVNWNGGGERLLARGAVSGTGVSWAPDGRTIALSGQAGIALVPSRGGRQRLVARGFVEPAWSPDGRRIAIVREGTRREGGIFLLPRRGGRPQRLTRGLDSQPAWAPDGRRLAFRRGGLIGDVYVVDAGGGRPRNLTSTLRLDEREPAWRPR
jgi:Tol biopolymer transport system component